MMISMATTPQHHRMKSRIEGDGYTGGDRKHTSTGRRTGFISTSSQFSPVHRIRPQQVSDSRCKNLLHIIFAFSVCAKIDFMNI